ncbi:hypothetical protein DSL92_00060 [Billgrantia gudaonensis]|uniref:Uncharacterized protein n=1 Tax=Billgrantia gudaonensis TaxID=376427 RepID=A0A3S0NXJ0_9GAMM|nr:hypothetical protein DSL92_00060 [Halomonas gudaonensis]
MPYGNIVGINAHGGVLHYQHYDTCARNTASQPRWWMPATPSRLLCRHHPQLGGSRCRRPVPIADSGDDGAQAASGRRTAGVVLCPA